MSADSFLVGPVSLGERLRAATPDYREWSDGELLLRWRGECTSLAVAGDAVLLATADGWAGGEPDGAGWLLDRFLSQGPRFLRELDGYASGVVYERSTGRLSAFRDVVGGAGVVLCDGPLLAASDVETLLPAWDRRTVDPMWVASLLQNQFLDPRSSGYLGLTHLEPGSIAVRTVRGGWAHRRVARLRPGRSPRPRPSGGRAAESAYVEHFADLLKRAIRRQLGGARRAAVMLSGGQDSSLLLALALEAAPEVQWRAYCIPFYSPKGDERDRQTAVAEHLGVPLTWVQVAGIGPLGRPGKALFGGLGAPPMIGNWFFGTEISRRADADGVEFVMDGEDADSLLHGDLTYLPDLLARLALRPLRREISRWERMTAVPGRTILRDVVHTLAPPFLRPALGDRGVRVQVSPLLARELSERLQVADRVRALKTLPWKPGRQFRAAREAGLARGLLDIALREGRAAWRGSRARLGHPYSDRTVIEFGLALPWQLLIGGRPKRIISLAAQGRLPDWFVQTPSKANLIEYWEDAVFRHDRERFGQGLDALRAYPHYVDPGALRQLREAWLAGGQAWLAGRAGGLGLWLATEGAGQDQEPVAEGPRPRYIRQDLAPRGGEGE